MGKSQKPVVLSTQENRAKKKLGTFWDFWDFWAATERALY